jgi:hypothetical protein
MCVHGWTLAPASPQVLSLAPAVDESGAFSHCTAQLSDGRSVQARRVLVAIGSTNMQRLPQFAQLLQPAGGQQGRAPDLALSGDWQPSAAADTCDSSSSSSSSSSSTGGTYSCPRTSGSRGGCASADSRPSLPTGRVMHAWEVASSFACIKQQLQGGTTLPGRTPKQVITLVAVPPNLPVLLKCRPPHWQI